MSLKEQIASDLTIFINNDEFGELHTVDGEQLSVIIDKDKLRERQSKAEYGYEGDLLFYVTKDAFGKPPAVGQIINFDGEIYRVSDVQEDMGMYSITLVANMS